MVTLRDGYENNKTPIISTATIGADILSKHSIPELRHLVYFPKTNHFY